MAGMVSPTMNLQRSQISNELVKAVARAKICSTAKQTRKEMRRPNLPHGKGRGRTQIINIRQNVRDWCIRVY